MLFIYDLGIFFYAVLIRVASLFNHKAKLFYSGRKNLFKKLIEQRAANPENLIWVHCASLGEFEQGRPLIESIKRKQPHLKILLTFFSPSGYEVRKNYEMADIVAYLPLDTKRNARRFLDVIEPKSVFFVKYEWWYHLTKEIYQRKIPLYSISSIFRPSQPFFKSTGTIQRKTLSHFSHFFVQNEQSKNLLNTIDITNVTVTGDTRFDRVAAICAQKKPFSEIEHFIDGQLTLIIGSSWPEDVKVIADTLKEYEQLKIIVAPHELHEDIIQHVETSFNRKCIRYSALEEQNEQQVLIIDNIGMLSSLYQYASIAYIGGAFGKGLHNILEAATFGLPVIFGPNYDRFQEAKDLIVAQAAFSVTNAASFKTIFDRLYNDGNFRKQCGQASSNYVLQNLGATEKIMKLSQWKG